MKKQFSVLLGILVSLSSLFISCGDKDEDLQPTICKITVQSSGDGDGTVSITNYIGTSVNALIGSNVEVVATPAYGSAFIGWYVSGSNTPVSTDARFVFIASENITLIAQFGMSVVVAVDLGLPSGLKWAKMNVGASSPEDYGDYYAWGETTAKSDYIRDSYQYHNGSSLINIGSNISGTQYDVARAQWGGSWRLPTNAEMQELKDRCTWTWITYKGIDGYKVTGPNGNSIFLPAAGYRYGTGINDRGSCGYYWSGTLFVAESYVAYGLYFYSSDRYVRNRNREYGHTVRPVSN